MEGGIKSQVPKLPSPLKGSIGPLATITTPSLGVWAPDFDTLALHPSI